MRKKILATLMVVGLLAAQTLTVCAAPSGATTPSTTTDGIVVTTSFGNAPVTPASDELAAINAYNGDSSADLATLFNATNGSSLANAVKGKIDLTGVFDCYPESGELSGSTDITFSVPNLSKSVKNVQIYHMKLDKEGQSLGWEKIPTKVNWSAKTVTGTFTSLSPVIIVAEKATSNGSGSGSGSSSSSSSSDGTATSPKTGVSSDWVMWIGAAVVLGAASVALKKKEA